MILSSGTTLSTPASAWPSRGTQQGKGNPSRLSATLQLETGWHPRSHPAQRRRNRSRSYGARPGTTTHLSGQTTKPPEATWDSSGPTQFPAAEMDPGSCPLPRLILQLAAYRPDHGLCRARQEDSQPCFMCLVATFGDLFRRSSYMKGARQGCQPKPGFRTLQSNY